MRGTLVLAELFRDQPLDFVALFSSVTAVLVAARPGGLCRGQRLPRRLRARGERARRPVHPLGQLGCLAGGRHGGRDRGAGRAQGLARGEPAPGRLAGPGRRGAGAGALRGSLAQVAVSRQDFQARIDGELHARSAGRAGRRRRRRARCTPGRRWRAPMWRRATRPRRRSPPSGRRSWASTGSAVHDNFFDLGGNSLVGLKVISRVKAELQADVSPVALFEGPTVAAMAKLTGRRKGPRRAAARSRRSQEPRRDAAGEAEAAAGVRERAQRDERNGFTKRTPSTVLPCWKSSL